MARKAPLAKQVAPGLPAAERVAEFIKASLDRAAAYSWPPAARAFAEGRAVKPTRRGLIHFYLWRRQFRPPLDLRAVEVETALAPDLFATTPPPADPTEGHTLAEFARWAGIDRRALGRHIIVVPPGPVPPLAPGQVPARKVGGVTRIFIRDFRGDRPEGENHGSDAHAAPSATSGSSWDRQIARLRGRGRSGG